MSEEMAQEVQQESEKKIFRLSEVAEHKERSSCWLIIHNNVYDVTGFLDEVSRSMIIYCVRNFIVFGRATYSRINELQRS